ncbi:HTH-type transcriptional regulator MetR [Hydrogenovibrio crunogenus]|uniref:HTH-type transcriptional regulator MetR n=1 Tax=Hydrogenovibrio crunogenus TaxID=39765 RepID=A0A4P7P256_9GAMM|nr:LysR family transcriptional regulator [Hydrogenovibrio crunogenus]QBZ84253.1 HTH-type transcriptional regulator MetR [Hydrogenovibrio crunogenus]RUM92513.1 MAG: LysR family transcriptional regulator [Thiomicrospira sp.]
MIELKHLKTLQALQQEGSVNKAATSLFMTQSALSHQIKQLEQSLNLKLFERKSSPLIWTSAGKILLKTAQDVLPKLDQAETTLRSLEKGEQGRLFIGVECHTCFEWLLPVMRAYQQEWQGVDLDIINSLANSANHSALQNLKHQKLDLVVTSDPVPMPELVFKDLFSYELVLVVPVGHALSELSWVSPEDFRQQTLIHYPVPREKLDIFKRFLNPAGIQPAAERHSEMTLMMLQLVEGHKGVCVLPKWLLETLPDFQHLPRIRIGAQGLWANLYAAIHRNSENKAYLNNFIERVKQRMT